MNVLSRSLRAGLPAAVIAVAVYLCFMHKAFNIDDVTFLTMADHMLDDPLHPASVQIVVNGRPPQWASNGVWSGPVMPAMLMPAVAAGGAEWLAHLVMLLVFLVGIFATAALALRLDVSDTGARWSAILLVTSAAVIAMAMTNMPDLPAMSFAVLGAERVVAFRQQGGLGRAIGAAVALALSLLSRQHVVMVLPCLLLVVSAWPRSVSELVAAVFDRRFLSTVATMVGAVVLVVLMYVVMRDPRPGDDLAPTPLRAADFSLLRVNLANIPAQWVLSFPLGLVWAWLYGRRMIRSWWCWVGALAGIYMAYQTHVFHRHLDWMPWQGPVTALGMAVLVDTVVDACRRRDAVDLGLAALLFIVVPVAVYSHLPPKYLVPAAPAMAVLIMRHVERRSSPGHRVLGVIAVQGLILGVLIIRADQVHGEIGRRGGTIAAEYIQRGERVWFDGTWGFQWYAMQAGARPVTTAEPQPAPGDIVVLGQEGWVIKTWPNKTLLERHTFETPGGRIMTKPAGFFSNVAWGPLPWRWGKKPLSPIEVWRIEQPAATTTP